MNTITFEEKINLKKRHFKTVEEFLLYLVQSLQKSELSSDHKKILDERLAEAKQNPENVITLDELKNSIKRE